MLQPESWPFRLTVPLVHFMRCRDGVMQDESSLLSRPSAHVGLRQEGNSSRCNQLQRDLAHFASSTNHMYVDASCVQHVWLQFLIKYAKQALIAGSLWQQALLQACRTSFAHYRTLMRRVSCLDFRLSGYA